MIINVSARHGHLSEASQEKVRAKLDKLVRLFDRITAIEVTVDLADRDAPSVEIVASAEPKHDFVATEQNGDLMQSLDGALHKIEQQIRKYKERVQEHRGPGLRQAGAASDGET